jgi:hypothetical protein
VQRPGGPELRRSLSDTNVKSENATSSPQAAPAPAVAIVLASASIPTPIAVMVKLLAAAIMETGAIFWVPCGPIGSSNPASCAEDERRERVDRFDVSGKDRYSRSGWTVAIVPTLSTNFVQDTVYEYSVLCST